MISIRIGLLFIIQSNFKFKLDKHWLLNFCNKIKKQNTCGCKKIIKLSLLMSEGCSFLSQAREPWITFSKVFAIQYDACHGRLNPCGGRLHSLRPVVSRLCFFSLHSDLPSKISIIHPLFLSTVVCLFSLHLILESKILIFHPLSVRIEL